MPRTSRTCAALAPRSARVWIPPRVPAGRRRGNQRLFVLRGLLPDDAGHRLPHPAPQTSGAEGGRETVRPCAQGRPRCGPGCAPPSSAGRECDDHYAVTFAEGTEITGRTIVLATGARYRRLDVPGIDRLERTSVYYAATSYEAQQCHEAPVAVVEGGNSAGQAVLFLAKRVPRVQLLARAKDPGAGMSRYLVDQIERHPRVTVLPHTEVREVTGGQVLRSLVVEDKHTRERRELEARALFVFIGAQPCTAWLSGKLSLDQRGFVLTGADTQARTIRALWQGQGRNCMSLETGLPGVFASGDVRSGSWKRVALRSAGGDGRPSRPRTPRPYRRRLGDGDVNHDRNHGNRHRHHPHARPSRPAALHTVLSAS
ncbi:NAD(P)/FAD-dependent oxidoreductase [Streptomyces sp. NPDC048527]|uniref:NAD(P)/FAD-dependent oxidoreductase n=1 Tax=Streptomyces sp. NPDC048527 TaxID=3365568 RepID=UPI00371206D1